MDFYTYSSDNESITVHYDVIAYLESLRTSFDDTPGPLGAPSLRQAYDAAVQVLKNRLQDVNISGQGSFSIPLPPQPDPDGGPPAVVSPQEILDQIVKGINAAEGTLNAQNFVIASGTVEARLQLPIAGVNVTFNIAPKPYN